MPTVFNRLKLKEGIEREDYDRWIVEFVYPHTEKIRSVVSQRIYPIDGLVVGGSELPYDYIEVIEVRNVEDFRRDLRRNAAAIEIRDELAKRADFLDSSYGDYVPPGVGPRRPDRLQQRPTDYPRGEAPSGGDAEDGGITIKWRTSQYIIEANSFEIPTIKGHIVGAGRSGGIGFFEHSFASLQIRFTVDMTNGTGLHTIYTVYTFEDEEASTFVTEGQGTTTAGEVGTPREFAIFEGKSTFQQGTGRYAGIQGSGHYSGRRLASFLPEAPTYLDQTATYRLPGP
jgi:hypothetical protein